MKGICIWLIWKLAYLINILCIALPMCLYVVCLLIIGIKRESSPTLSIVMAITLHPVSTSLFGYSTNLIGHYISSRLCSSHSNKTWIKLLRRVFTYSLNCHLAMVGALIYCLFELWITFQNQTSINFENKSFNQCTCDILSAYGHGEECTNDETQNSFQNRFLHVPIKEFFIALIITSISCHLIQSIIIWIPKPLGLHDLILGHWKAKDLDTTGVLPNNPHRFKIIKGFKFFSSIMVLVLYIGAVNIIPLTTFDMYSGNGKYRKNFCHHNLIKIWLVSITDSTCQTIDNYPCSFPFKYQGKDHFYCSFLSRKDISEGKVWCAIKSIGECKSFCPERKLYHKILGCRDSRYKHEYLDSR